MKKENGFIKFLLVLIVIALAGIIMLFGYVTYNEFAGNGDVDFGNLQLIYPKIENQESDNRINNTKATTDTKISGSTVGTQVLTKNEYQNKYLYSQLGENGKIIYEINKTKSDLSDNISKDLISRGMKFVGSTTIYSYLQAVGIIFSHDYECFLAVRNN